MKFGESEKDRSGVFIFDGFYNSLMAVEDLSKRWELFDAIFKYGLSGEETHLSAELVPVFLVMKPFLDKQNDYISKKQKFIKGGKKGERKVVKTPNKDVNSGGGEVSSEGGGETGVGSRDDGTKKSGDVSFSLAKEHSGNVDVGLVCVGACENKNKKNNTNKKNNINITQNHLLQTNNRSEKSLRAGDSVREGFDENDFSRHNGGEEEDEEGERKYLFVEKNGLIPTLEEVEEFAKSAKLSVNPSLFYNYYKSKGWKEGGYLLNDWRACLITWQRKQTVAIESLKVKEEVEKEKKELQQREANDRHNVWEAFPNFDDVYEEYMRDI